MKNKTSIDNIKSHLYKNGCKYLSLFLVIFLSITFGQRFYNFYTSISEFENKNPNYKNISIEYGGIGDGKFLDVEEKYYVLDYKEVKNDSDGSVKVISTEKGVVPQTCVSGVFFKYHKYGTNRFFHKIGKENVVCGKVTILSQGDK